MGFRNENYKLSIEECFKLNEYLVNGTPCSFEKTIKVEDSESIDIIIEIEDAKLIISSVAFPVIGNDVYILNEPKDIKDIFGLYDFNFEYGPEKYKIVLNLTNEFDDEYFSSAGEYFISQLDYIKYKMDLGEDKLLLKYLKFYNMNNSANLVLACYILEHLRKTPLYEDAKDLFLRVIEKEIRGIQFSVMNTKVKIEEYVKGYLKKVINKKTVSIYELSYALINLHLVLSDSSNPYHKLVSTSINKKVIYNSIYKSFLGLDDEFAYMTK